MQKTMSIITECLLNELNLDISKLRFDSKHVFSNMADWSRKQLLFQNMQCFLKRVRHYETLFTGLLIQNFVSVMSVTSAGFSGTPRRRNFSEQFIDNDGKTELNKYPDEKVLLNLSDLVEEIGHNEVGYQIQFAETSSNKNEVQLITAAIPQVEKKLLEGNHLPKKLYTSADYSPDENYVAFAVAVLNRSL